MKAYTVTTLIMFSYFSSDTTVFVDRLFKGLDTESYLTGEDPPTIPSPPPKATAPPSSSRSSKGDSKNERSDTSSPLQSASRRPSEDIRQREVSCRTTFSLCNTLYVWQSCVVVSCPAGNNLRKIRLVTLCAFLGLLHTSAGFERSQRWQYMDGLTSTWLQLSHEKPQSRAQHYQTDFL